MQRRALKKLYTPRDLHEKTTTIDRGLEEPLAIAGCNKWAKREERGQLGRGRKRNTVGDLTARPTPASDTDATLRASNENPLTLSTGEFLQQEARHSAEPCRRGKKRSNFRGDYKRIKCDHNEDA